MKSRAQMDLDLGKFGRDLGIARSTISANNRVPRWSDHALEFLRQYAATRSTFIGDEVARAADRSVPPPPDKRAWGGVFMTAKAKKWIERIGYTEATNPNCHGSPTPVYKSHLFVEGRKP